jgi:hypothetical protein
MASINPVLTALIGFNIIALNNRIINRLRVPAKLPVITLDLLSAWIKRLKSREKIDKLISRPVPSRW